MPLQPEQKKCCEKCLVWGISNPPVPICRNAACSCHQTSEQKIHHTCIHSDKYDYACGDCIDRILKEQKEAMIEKVEGMMCQLGNTDDASNAHDSIRVLMYGHPITRENDPVLHQALGKIKAYQNILYILKS